MSLATNFAPIRLSKMLVVALDFDLIHPRVNGQVFRLQSSSGEMNLISYILCRMSQVCK